MEFPTSQRPFSVAAGPRSKRTRDVRSVFEFRVRRRLRNPTDMARRQSRGAAEQRPVQLPARRCQTAALNVALAVACSCASSSGVAGFLAARQDVLGFSSAPCIQRSRPRQADFCAQRRSKRVSVGIGGESSGEVSVEELQRRMAELEARAEKMVASSQPRVAPAGSQRLQPLDGSR